MAEASHAALHVGPPRSAGMPTVVQLRAELQRLGLDTKGLKAVLEARLAGRDALAKLVDAALTSNLLNAPR